ncbi:MAG: CPBP family intramembrane metalloprotease [Solobacterium sp.]|nr:CPBP family intramembrane metalloprotease [Solobacterium sp.]
MKELLNRIHNENFKWNDFFLIPSLLSLVIVLLGQMLGYRIGRGLQSVIGITPITDHLMLYFSFIGIWIVLFLYLRFTKTNTPILKALTSGPENNTPAMLGIGLLLGFLMNGFGILCAWLHKDIYLSFDSFHIGYLLLFLITIFIQSSAEELIDRGFLYQRIRRGYRGHWFAILLNSFVFMSLHLANPGTTKLALFNIFVVGVFYGTCVRYLDSIWICMGIHTAWNFTQNIIFGLPNSGIVTAYSIFRLDAANARDSLFYSNSFGIEGTIITTLIHVIGIIAIVWWGEKNKRTSYNPWLDRQTAD